VQKINDLTAVVKKKRKAPETLPDGVVSMSSEKRTKVDDTA
jgi:hypothetical protein